MVKPGVLVQAYASPRRFDSQGNLIDDQTKKLLREHLEEFSKWTQRLARPGEFVQYACEMDIDRAAA